MKYFGKVGYGKPGEIREGVWVDTIVEYAYYGDVVKDTRRLVSGQDVNPDITPGNSIEIVADPYAFNHFHAIKYAELAGALWTVTDVEQKRPRLLLRLGGVYNGPRPATESDSGTTTGTTESSRIDSGR
jgi:hypothetical protein